MTGASDRSRPGLVRGLVAAIAAMVLVTTCALVWKHRRDGDLAELGRLEAEVRSVETEALRAVAADPPDWTKAKDVLDRAASALRQIEALAARRGDDPELSERRDAALARHGELEDRVLRAKAAEDAFATAVSIAQARDVSRYPDALRALEEVHESSPLAQDAQTYRTWIRADMEVRAATAAGKRGEFATARRLLRHARTFPGLGPAAYASIERKLAALDRAPPPGAFSPRNEIEILDEADDGPLEAKPAGPGGADARASDRP